MQTDAISRSAVLAIINDRSYDTAYPSEYDELVSEINKLPALDVEPVIRCKDCRYSEPMALYGVTKFGSAALNCTQCRGDDGYGYAGISAIYPDDYCSDGAPKEEAYALD